MKKIGGALRACWRSSGAAAAAPDSLRLLAAVVPLLSAVSVAVQRVERTARGRVRRTGAGRPASENNSPAACKPWQRSCEPTRLAILAPAASGRARQTLRALERALHSKGLPVSFGTIRRLWGELGYAIRINHKRLRKKQDPQRDRQMRYLARWRGRFRKAGKPVRSVATKKRELVGNFRQPGGAWRRAAIAVLSYDYPRAAAGVALPFGIYALARNEGFVVVGLSHHTPELAVAAIRRWWLQVGHTHYPGQQELLIEADCGKPHSNRGWRWKYGLQQLADKFALLITVTHLPTGASKWNPIAHRLFSPSSGNWAGEPLVSYEKILNFVRTTKTETGLSCKAYLDKTVYETGLQLTPEDKEQSHLVPHRVLPKLNYTIKPHG